MPVIDNAVGRIRDALRGITATPRQRITFVLILVGALVVVVGVFVWLVLRRQAGATTPMDDNESDGVVT